MQPTPRLYALDNLRAIMMWLGIVLHVSVNHVTSDFPIPWRDSQQTLLADMIVAFIHSFRMPVFFIVAGFFVAMLIDQRGATEMLKHRLKRLALPFAIFWPLVFPTTVVLVMVFVHLMVRGTLGIDPTLVPKSPSGVLISTLHLWFLYMLIWFCVLAVLWEKLKSYVPTAGTKALQTSLVRLCVSYWGVLLLAIPLAIAGAPFRAGVLVVSGSFIPPIQEWVHHGLFFIVGMVIQSHQSYVLNEFTKRCKTYGLLGVLLYAAWVLLYEADLKNPAQLPYPKLVMAYVYNCSTWMLSFALIGGFLRYFPTQTPVLKYLAASSYWSYLVHMLGTIGFGILLYQAPLGALAKMTINMVATSLFCLATYHWFVRERKIGRLLNG